MSQSCFLFSPYNGVLPLAWYFILHSSIRHQTVINAVSLPIRNVLNVSVDRDYYPSFKSITCRISGLNSSNSKKVSLLDTTDYGAQRNVRVVRSSELDGTGKIDTLTNLIPFWVRLKYSNVTDGKVNVSVQLDYDIVIGPRMLTIWNYDRVGNRIDNGYTNTTMDNSWTAGPLRCIVVNDNNTKVVGVSQPFTVGPPNPLTIHVTKDSFIPGDALQASVVTQNRSSYEDWMGRDYLRVYKVPYDLSNHSSLLRTAEGAATFVGPLYFSYSEVLSLYNF
jgi:hypothetical protein